MEYPWRIAPQLRYPEPLGIMDGDGQLVVCTETLVHGSTGGYGTYGYPDTAHPLSSMGTTRSS